MMEDEYYITVSVLLILDRCHFDANVPILFYHYNHQLERLLLSNQLNPCDLKSILEWQATTNDDVLRQIWPQSKSSQKFRTIIIIIYHFHRHIIVSLRRVVLVFVLSVKNNTISFRNSKKKSCSISIRYISLLS